MTETTGPPDPPATAAPAAAETLLILAIDHRDSLERDLYGLTAPPTPAQAARISADKLLVYRALLDAAVELPDGVRPGILIDEQYGAGVAELTAASGGAVQLAMPIEASGEQWFHFAYQAKWREHAEFFPANYAKVLVRDNPGLQDELREQQAGRLAEVSEWARRIGRPLIVELLVPATDADRLQVGNDSSRYDRELRPALTLAVIEYLQDRGVEPTLWKVEGLDRHDDAVAVAAMASRGARDARCIVLGRHASHEQLDQWLQVAAPVPGFIGFAIGRSIWWDALHSQLRHSATADDARRRIASAYLDFARYYLSAQTMLRPKPHSASIAGWTATRSL